MLFEGTNIFDDCFLQSPDIKILLVKINELGPSLYVKRVYKRFRYISHLPKLGDLRLGEKFSVFACPQL